MSALTPHLKVLRAEAEALSEEAGKMTGATDQQITAKILLLALSISKFTAADALEAEERERGAPLLRL